jgi:hypothetical protein
MQHTILPRIVDPSAPLFIPAPDRHLAEHDATRARAIPDAECSPDAALAMIRAASTPVSERFCGALALSALLGIASAPMLAHAATVQSHVLMLCGLSSLAAAVVIQIAERRRAIIELTRAGMAKGLDAEDARDGAHSTLKLWLS